MFVPKLFKISDVSEIHDFIKTNSFGILVSQSNSRLLATHIPLTLHNDNGGSYLFGHIARANPQWQNFKEDEEVLAIFQGPHSYISSSWYDHENAPTWNYIAVHIYGKIRIIEGEELIQSMKSMLDKYERDSEKPVKLETMDADYVHKNFQAIVGFKISVDDIQAASKLSQNRGDKNHREVIHQLEKRGDANSIAIAEAMKKDRPK